MRRLSNKKRNCLHGFAQQIFTRVPWTGSGVVNLYQKQEREATMLARKQKIYSILDDEIDEDNIVFEHKSVTKKKKRYQYKMFQEGDN